MDHSGPPGHISTPFTLAVSLGGMVVHQGAELIASTIGPGPFAQVVQDPRLGWASFGLGVIGLLTLVTNRTFDYLDQRKANEALLVENLWYKAQLDRLRPPEGPAPPATPKD